MTARADFALILSRNRRAVDAERREFAERVGAILATETRGRELFDTMAYARTMRALGAVLDEFYGRWPNDREARFWKLILGQCRAARGLAFARARADVRRRLKREPALRRMVEREAA